MLHSAKSEPMPMIIKIVKCESETENTRGIEILATRLTARLIPKNLNPALSEKDGVKLGRNPSAATDENCTLKCKITQSTTPQARPVTPNIGTKKIIPTMIPAL